MHRNKLPGTLIFKIFQGSTRFPSAGGGALLQNIIPQDRRYRDEIVLRLLYNFLLLHFFQFENPAVKLNFPIKFFVQILNPPVLTLNNLVIHRSISPVQGFQIEKNVAGGNCKVAGALFRHDNGGLVGQCSGAEHPLLQRGIGCSPGKF